MGVVAIVAIIGLFRVMSVRLAFVSVPNLDAYYSASTTNGLSGTLEKLSKDPKDTDGWMSFAMNRKGAGDYIAARDAWEYVVSLNPNYFVPYNNLGDLYHYFLKDYARAEKNLLKAIAIDPVHVLGYVNLFDLYHLSYKKNTDAAEKILLRGLTAVQNDGLLTSKLAEYYKEKNRMSDARMYYQKGLDQAISSKDADAEKFFREAIASLPAEK